MESQSIQNSRAQILGNDPCSLSQGNRALTPFRREFGDTFTFLGRKHWTETNHWEGLASILWPFFAAIRPTGPMSNL